MSLDDVYCRHILEGRLPELIADTATVPLAASMPITHAVPIGRHLSVPIRLKDGTVYGMFCCVGVKADHTLHKRDLQVMKVFADLAAHEIERDVDVAKVAQERQRRIEGIIAQGQIGVAYQPIWGSANDRPIGFECLARFSAKPVRSPDKWFAEAAEVGLGTTLEVATIKLGLSALDVLPPDIYIAVNVSPAAILSSELAEALSDLPAQRIVLEITEHAHVEDYDALLRALYPLRNNGMRLAVDDAGAGYSGLQHILQIHPDLIKLDMALTRHIDIDPARKALAAAMVAFARDTGSCIIAEGVETVSELNTLRSIGIENAQGYFLGRPMPINDAMTLLQRQKPAAQHVAGSAIASDRNDWRSGFF
jgi:EAL domain-containing protein (putative c-di-GMP-specific phosphodiesterase class I)